jgi:molecular chaperone DnaK
VFVGIDLGTTTSLAAVVDDQMNTEILQIGAERLIPSAVYFPPTWQPGQDAVVGSSALARRQLHPDRVVIDSKREMEAADYRFRVGDFRVSAEDVATQILGFFRRELEHRTGQAVRDAVVTVPAYFQHLGKSHTRKAALAAGFESVRILQEPVAAALAYHAQQPLEPGERLFVFDLGGGTLDTSVLLVQGERIEVEVFDGDDRLGGADFDACLLDFLLDRFRQQFAFDFRKRFAPVFAARALAKLSAEARKTKEALSSLQDVPVRVVLIDEDDEDYELRTSVSRIDFEQVSLPLLERMDKVVARTLDTAGPVSIDRVALVGGSSRIPFVTRRLGELLKQAPYQDQMPDELVARGAGLFHMVTRMAKAGGQASIPQVRFVSAHSLGILVDQDRLAVLIPKGTLLPAEFTEGFTTVEDNQEEIDLEVYMGEHLECCSAKNQLVGEGTISGIELGVAGKADVSVTFCLSEEDLLKVEAVDNVTGAREDFELRPGARSEAGDDDSWAEEDLDEEDED